MTLPVVWDLTAYRGDTWSQTFRFKHGGELVDLTNALVECEARSKTARVDLVVVKGDGEVTISLPPDTAADNYDYDVEVTESGFVQTWVKGRLIVNPDVTNEPAVP